MTIYHNPPKACDLCKSPITDEFSDAKLMSHGGVWGNVCPACASGNVRYGTGFGQRYQKNEKGQFVKVLG